MWKVLPNCSRYLLRSKQLSPHIKVRWFLSESFKMDNVWRNRFQSPILKKINVDDLFYELDNQFQHFAYASALDVDLFVNSVKEENNFDEVEDILHKLRLSPEAVNILPSTQHALIRLYTEWNKTDDLIRILDDRLNYGIFLDDYCSLLLMDKFIKDGNFKDAARISTLNMLQEDISNPLIKYMSLYSCHKYLENPVPWTSIGESSEEGDDGDDDEVVKVRVKFLRNPYFDDHFDLVEPQHLIGKTLTFIGSGIDDSVGRTYKLLGLLLHNKFNEAKKYIQMLSSIPKNCIFKDGLVLANKMLEEKAEINKDEMFLKNVDEIKTLISTSFTEAQLDQSGKLLDTVENILKDLVLKNETTEIDKQLEVYKNWEKNREKLLVEQIEKLKREKRLAEVQQQKQLLQEKEEELFFFDNENKLDLIIEEMEKKKEEEKERERKKMEEKMNVKKEKWLKDRPPEPKLEDFFDENIPMKLVKTKF